jgi:hypothetical protein
MYAAFQSVEQISCRLETLDHRLARLESMEQQLEGLHRLEKRVADVERTVMDKILAVPDADEQTSNKMELVNSQLNNLVARMTLVENKIIMLQSAEVTSILSVVICFLQLYCLKCLDNENQYNG